MKEMFWPNLTIACSLTAFASICAEWEHTWVLCCMAVSAAVGQAMHAPSRPGWLRRACWMNVGLWLLCAWMWCPKG